MALHHFRSFSIHNTSQTPRKMIETCSALQSSSRPFCGFRFSKIRRIANFSVFMSPGTFCFSSIAQYARRLYWFWLVALAKDSIKVLKRAWTIFARYLCYGRCTEAHEILCDRSCLQIFTLNHWFFWFSGISIIGFRRRRWITGENGWILGVWLMLAWAWVNELITPDPPNAVEFVYSNESKKGV